MRAPGICQGPRGGPPPAVVVEADVVCGGGVVLVLVSHLVISHERQFTQWEDSIKLLAVPWAQVSLVTGHWSVCLGQVSPGSGAARLSLRAPSVSRHCARPALPLTAHICANQNWFLPISKYL